MKARSRRRARAARRTLRFLLAVSVALACAGCGNRTICRSPAGEPPTASCISEKLREGDEVWVYRTNGAAIHGNFVAIQPPGPVETLIVRQPWEHGKPDSIPLSEVRELAVTRSHPGLLFIGGVAFGVLLAWIALLSLNSIHIS